MSEANYAPIEDLQCVRCKRIAKTREVEGIKLCAICCDKLKEWAATFPVPPPKYKYRGGRCLNRLEQAKVFCEYYGFVTIGQHAAHNQETKYRVYWSYRQFIKFGKMIKLGHGRYGLAKREGEE
jgi:hypothetical protein